MDGLTDERRDSIWALMENGLLQLPRRSLPYRLMIFRSPEAVWIAGLDMNEARNARLKHFPVRAHRGSAHSLKRDPMISVMPGDHLDLGRLALRFPVKTRRLERRLVGLGASGGEEDRLHPRSEFREAIGQHDRGDVGRTNITGKVGE